MTLPFPKTLLKNLVLLEAILGGDFQPPTPAWFWLHFILNSFSWHTFGKVSFFPLGNSSLPTCDKDLKLNYLITIPVSVIFYQNANNRKLLSIFNLLVPFLHFADYWDAQMLLLVLSKCKKIFRLWMTQKDVKGMPWLMWLSGLSACLWTKGSLVQFPVRAHVRGRGPQLQECEKQPHIDVSLPLPPFPSL